MAEDRPQSNLSLVLDAAEHGDERASAELLPLVYEELRALARHRLAHEPSGGTLQPTALVHEAYLRVRGTPEREWRGRRHFFAAAAESMRRILVEEARARGRLKRGGAQRRVDLDLQHFEVAAPPERLIAVDEAMRRLEATDPRKGKIVNLRYFSGLTVEETAGALDVSVGTIEREWRFIRAWLQRELVESADD